MTELIMYYESLFFYFMIWFIRVRWKHFNDLRKHLKKSAFVNPVVIGILQVSSIKYIQGDSIGPEFVVGDTCSRSTE